jgi:hypothetical protein
MSDRDKVLAAQRRMARGGNIQRERARERERERVSEWARTREGDEMRRGGTK